MNYNNNRCKNAINDDAHERLQSVHLHDCIWSDLDEYLHDSDSESDSLIDCNSEHRHDL